VGKLKGQCEPADGFRLHRAGKKQHGVVFLQCKMDGSAIGRFLQPDSIVPEIFNPLGLDRYQYSRNNPINYNDPTGHMSREDDGKGADREGILHSYATDILYALGGRDDLEALAQIVDKAYDLYNTYDQMIPAISGVILGIKESNTYTVWNAAFKNTGCAGVGRDPQDCGQNSAEKGGRAFGDTGFHQDFQDGHNQLFHAWAYISTTMATDDGIWGSGSIVSTLANIVHEVIWQEPLSSWQDYALGTAGMDIGGAAKMGAISSPFLGSYIRVALGPNGGGSSGYTSFLNSFAPLPWFNK
jgi:RHS repeat-associated protein